MTHSDCCYVSITDCELQYMRDSMYSSEDLSCSCTLEGNVNFFPKCVYRHLDTKTAEVKEATQARVVDVKKNGKNSWS